MRGRQRVRLEGFESDFLSQQDIAPSKTACRAETQFLQAPAVVVELFNVYRAQIPDLVATARVDPDHFEMAKRMELFALPGGETCPQQLHATRFHPLATIKGRQQGTKRITQTHASSTLQLWNKQGLFRLGIKGTHEPAGLPVLAKGNRAKAFAGKLPEASFGVCK